MTLIVIIFSETHSSEITGPILNPTLDKVVLTLINSSNLSTTNSTRIGFFTSEIIHQIKDTFTRTKLDHRSISQLPLTS